MKNNVVEIVVENNNNVVEIVVENNNVAVFASICGSFVEVLSKFPSRKFCLGILCF